MKKLLIALFVIIQTICCSFGFVACKAELEYSAIEENGEVISYCVTGRGSAGKIIEIPSTYKDKPVTAIGDGAFRQFTAWKSLTSITIPDSIVSIGNSAFAGCKSLTKIIIPDSVTSLGNCVFENCIDLTSLTFSNSLTEIGDGAFRNCSLTNIIFNGTKEQWKAIENVSQWNYKTGEYTVHCTDGDLTKEES